MSNFQRSAKKAFFIIRSKIPMQVVSQTYLNLNTVFELCFSQFLFVICHNAMSQKYWKQTPVVTLRGRGSWLTVVMYKTVFLYGLLQKHLSPATATILYQWILELIWIGTPFQRQFYPRPDLNWAGSTVPSCMGLDKFFNGVDDIIESQYRLYQIVFYCVLDLSLETSLCG